MTRLIDMEESTTYQAILQKGMTRGVAVGERQLLVRQGTQKFGPPDDLTLATLEAIADPKELERIGLLLLRASSWAEVLGT